jgi:hypothetical protein
MLDTLTSSPGRLFGRYRAVEPWCSPSVQVFESPRESENTLHKPRMGSYNAQHVAAEVAKLSSKQVDRPQLA